MRSPHSTKVLVTGGGGYIGRVLKLLLTNQFPGSHTIDENSPYWHCELERLPLSFLREFSHLIHLADLRLDELNHHNIEINCARHHRFFLQLQRLRRPPRVIFSSSCSVYGRQADSISEEAPVLPTTAYAQSKLLTEQLLHTSGLPFLILRFGTAFGASPRLRRDLLINQLLLAHLDRRGLRIFDPESVRPYVATQDFARALLFACRLSKPDPSLFNVVSFNANKRQLVAALESISANSGRPLIEWDMKQSDPRHYAVSGRAWRERGFTFQYNLHDGLLDFIRQTAPASRIRLAQGQGLSIPGSERGLDAF